MRYEVLYCSNEILLIERILLTVLSLKYKISILRLSRLSNRLQDFKNRWFHLLLYSQKLKIYILNFLKVFSSILDYKMCNTIFKEL